MTPEEFLQIAAEHQLAHIGEMLFSTTVPGIRVFERALRDALPDDKTFIGGMPSPMPRHWPDHAHTPLTFVGQVDTSSLPPGVSPVSLPSGILQFFVPSMSETTGYEPSLDR